MATVNYIKGKKIKKEETNIAGWIFLLLFIAWNSIWISIWVHENFAFSWAGLAIISTITGVLGLAAVLTAWDIQYVRTLEFIIFEFEIWDKEQAQYVKAYDYGRKNLYTDYFLDFYTSTHESSTDEKDILSRYNDSSFSRYAYDSKEAVMRSILDEVKSMLENKMENEKIVIRNVSTAETISVEELIKMVKGENQ